MTIKSYINIWGKLVGVKINVLDVETNITTHHKHHSPYGMVGAPQEGVTRYKTLAASAKNTNRTTIGNNVDCPHLRTTMLRKWDGEGMWKII